MKILRFFKQTGLTIKNILQSQMDGETELQTNESASEEKPSGTKSEPGFQLFDLDTIFAI